MGNFFIVSCFVDSWCISQVLHLIFAEEPKFSGRVKCSKQSINVLGALLSSDLDVQGAEPRSNEMSQKGSIVVETFLKREREEEGGLKIKWKQSKKIEETIEGIIDDSLAKLTNNIRL